MNFENNIINHSPMENKMETLKSNLIENNEKSPSTKVRKRHIKSLDEQIAELDNKILSEEEKIKSSQKNISELKAKRLKLISKKDNEELKRFLQVVKEKGISIDNVIDNIDLFIERN